MLQVQLFLIRTKSCVDPLLQEPGVVKKADFSAEDEEYEVIGLPLLDDSEALCHPFLHEKYLYFVQIIPWLLAELGPIPNEELNLLLSHGHFCSPEN